MGLRFSAENIRGWRSQYEAMFRWYERCEARHGDGNIYNTEFLDALDHILAFFVFSYHICDFVVETGGVKKERMNELVRMDICMSKCRDIPNRIKHHTLHRKPSVDADWSVGREYVPPISGPAGEKLFFVIGGEKIDAMAVVRECVSFWQKFADSGELNEPLNPFA